jgi:hypothetical protein
MDSFRFSFYSLNLDAKTATEGGKTSAKTVQADRVTGMSLQVCILIQKIIINRDSFRKQNKFLILTMQISLMLKN